MKHIIWDFNGTLLNDAQLSVDLDNDVFDQIGVPRITLEDYRNNMTMPVRDFYPRVGVDYAKHSYEEIARLWLDEFNKRAVGVGLRRCTRRGGASRCSPRRMSRPSARSAPRWG